MLAGDHAAVEQAQQLADAASTLLMGQQQAEALLTAQHPQQVPASAIPCTAVLDMARETFLSEPIRTLKFATKR